MAAILALRLGGKAGESSRLWRRRRRSGTGDKGCVAVVPSGSCTGSSWVSIVGSRPKRPLAPEVGLIMSTIRGGGGGGGGDQRRSSASASEGVNSISIVPRSVRSSGSGEGLSWRHFQPRWGGSSSGLPCSESFHSSLQIPLFFYLSIISECVKGW